MTTLETPIFPDELMRLLGIGHANTLRRYIKDGKVPEPDKKLSQKTRYWHRATLVKAGVIAPEPAGAPSASTTTKSAP